MLAALNTAGRRMPPPSWPGAVLAETLRRRRRCQPAAASPTPTPAAAFVDPALRLARRSAATRSLRPRLQGARLRGRSGRPRWISSDGTPSRSPDEARDPGGARRGSPRELVPGLTVPDRSPRRSSTRISPCAAPPARRRLLGVVGGTAEWVFAYRRSHLGDGQRRRPAGRQRPRRAGAHGSGRDVAAALALRCAAAALADRQGEARDLRRHARAGRGCARPPRPAGATSSSPATGPRPDCPPRSKARCARATPRRAWRWGQLGGLGAAAMLTDAASDCPSARAIDRGRRARAPRSAGRRRSRPTATGCSSSRPTRRSRPNMCCCAITSASRSTPSWRREIGRYLRRIQSSEHGGWPLFHDGGFDISATVKAYYALKMIGDDVDAPHMARARAAILRGRRRGGGQRLHPHPAGALRGRAVGGGADDAGRADPAAALVPDPPVEDVLLGADRDRAAAGALRAAADGAQPARHQGRRAVHRRRPAKLDSRAAEHGKSRCGSTASPRSTRCSRRSDRLWPKQLRAARDRRLRRPWSASGSTARTGSARSIRRWRTA